MMEQEILFRAMKTFQIFHHTVVGFRSMSPETNITYEKDYTNKTGNTDVSRAVLGSTKILSVCSVSFKTSKLQVHKFTTMAEYD
jgi:hypothetical protein